MGVTESEKFQQAERSKIAQLHQQLKAVANPQSLRQTRKLLDSFSDREIAHFLESSPPIQRSLIWQLLNPERETEVFVRLSEEVQETIVTTLDKSEVISLVESMEVDDIADLLNQLPERVTQEVLNQMSQQDRDRLEKVLDYQSDTAGGLMDTNIVTVRASHSVEIVLRYLRRFSELPENTNNLFVVDRDGNYQGRVLIRKILTANPQDLIADVMETKFQCLEAYTQDTEVVRLFQENNWLSIAVVHNSKLVGRITIDDIVDLMAEEQDRSMLNLAGLSEDEDTFASFNNSFGRRSLWLGINLVTAIVAASVIDQFQATIERVLALAVILPLVASMGGICGTQAMTVVIRGLALNQISSSNLFWLLRREVLLSFASACIWALVAGLALGLWFDDYQLTIIVLIALTINLIIGAISGTLLPVLLKHLKIDPAVACGVILTTITDIVGFLSFLLLATIYYGG